MVTNCTGLPTKYMRSERGVYRGGIWGLRPPPNFRFRGDCGIYYVLILNLSYSIDLNFLLSLPNNYSIATKYHI